MTIEQAIQSEQWSTARKLIRASLRQNPDSHWLITRLGLTYYEQHDYQRSLLYCEQAFQIAPRCPLVLWDLAGTHVMLGLLEDSEHIYRQIIRRGVAAIAQDECGEGLPRSRGLVADCWYRIARIEMLRERHSRATTAFRRHLDLRGPGCRSIYPIAKVRSELNDISKITK